MSKKKYYQRPDGLFETSRRVNGKRVMFRGRTCQEVDRKILEFTEQIVKGRKFEVIAEEWYDSVYGKIRASTRNNYAISLEHAKKFFKGVNVAEIKPLDVQRYMYYFLERGYQKNTTQEYLSTLKQILSYAVLKGDLNVNPATEIRMPRNIQGRKRLPLTEEQELIVENCRTGKYWLFGLFLLYTGSRKGEALAVEWKDIDREHKVIHINKKINFINGRAITEPFLKNSEYRDIPLFDLLADALPKNRIGKVFPHIERASDYVRLWTEYCRDTGFVDSHGEPTVTAHQFRHSFATICYESGISSKDASVFLGDTEKITNSIYTEVRLSKKTTSADKVNAYLEMRKAEKQAQA